MADVKISADKQTDKRTDGRTDQKLYAHDLSMRRYEKHPLMSACADCAG